MTQLDMFQEHDLEQKRRLLRLWAYARRGATMTLSDLCHKFGASLGDMAGMLLELEYDGTLCRIGDDLWRVEVEDAAEPR